VELERMTNGRRSLIALLQLTSGRELAARCGVSPSKVSMWLAGLSAPSDVPRARLEAIYGIGADSWGRGPVVRTSSCRHPTRKETD
jgi:transcriptional regulator with XRE-family HTH domain